MPPASRAGHVDHELVTTRLIGVPYAKPFRWWMLDPG